MADLGLATRAAAVNLLLSVTEGQDMLTGAEAALAKLDPQERARAQRLAATVLRHVDAADRVLKPFLRKTPPAFVQVVLWLAVIELVVEGAAAHGVVNSAVSLVRRGPRTEGFAGLVNAILRKVAALDAPFAKLPPQRMPDWLRQPLVLAYGKPAVAAMEAVQAKAPPTDITLRRGATAWPEGQALPTGSVRLAAQGQVTAQPGYAEGQWWVQDAAAALAVPLLAPQPGEQVLDLCAAPGGKTLQIADAGADVTALDISGPRLERMQANLARMGLAAKIVTADAMHWVPDAPFDAILLDAPCSATGTIRRHPDLPFIKDGSELPGLVALQAALLERALGWLKPGGRLVYCTCSLLPEEGEAQISAALLRHPGITVEAAALPGIPADWVGAAGGLRLRPDYWADQGGMDGFFMARLRRVA